MVINKIIKKIVKGFLVLFFSLVIITESVVLFMFQKTRVYSFETKAFTLDPNNNEGVFDLVTNIPIPTDGWIREISFEVINGPDDSLHHIVLAYTGEKDLTCPNLPERLITGVKELTPVILPDGYGYPIENEKNFAIFTHMVNPTGDLLRDLRVKTNILIKPKSLFSDVVKKTRPIWLDIVNCSWDPTVFVNPGEKTRYSLSPRIKVPFDLSVIYGFAHVHDYSTGLKVLLDNTEVLNFDIQKDNNTIKRIKPFIFGDSSQIKMKEGQELDIVASYANSREEKIDAMGISVLYVVEE